MLFLNFSLCTEIRRQPLCEIFHLLESVLVMMFGQFSNRESLRGLIVALEAHQGKRYHLGLGRELIAKTTLASANQNRDYRIFEDFAFYMMKEACEKRATNLLDVPGRKIQLQCLQLIISQMPIIYSTERMTRLRNFIGFTLQVLSL